MINKDFSEYRDTKREITHLKETIEKLESELTSPRTSIVTDMPRNPSPNQDQLACGIIRLEELKDKYQELVGNLCDKQLQIEESIKDLEPIERDLIRYRYFDGLNWQEIQEKLEVSPRTSFRIHKRAVGKICTDER